MEWFVLTAPLPAAVDILLAPGPVILVLLAIVLAPVALVVWDALRAGSTRRERPQLQVVEGGKELGRRAA